MSLFRTFDVVAPTFEDLPEENGAGSTAGLTPPVAKIGQILADSGKLKPEKIPKILKLQHRKGLRFGEAALKLGFVKSQDLMQALSRQFAYPCLQPGEGKFSREVVAAYQSSPSQIEALRQQRSLLTQYWFAQSPALAIVSPDHGDGRSYLAANLAVLFAQLGRRTLLIDADMRRPRQHEIFHVVNRLGLSSFLAGRAGTEIIQPLPVLRSLAVLSAGPIPPNPHELLDRGGLSGLLERAYRDYQVIIVDTPAGNYQGDAHIVARHCQGALMVARRHRTRLSDARNMIEHLSNVDVQLVGSVLNQF